MRGFSGYFPPIQLLYLWDLIIAYDSMEVSMAKAYVHDRTSVKHARDSVREEIDRLWKLKVLQEAKGAEGACCYNRRTKQSEEAASRLKTESWKTTISIELTSALVRSTEV